MFQNLRPKPVSFLKPQKKETSVKKLGYTKKNSESYNQKIKNLEAEISLLTNYSTDTIYRLDYGTMKYDYISPAVEKLLGFNMQEMRRINFRSLILETRLVTDGLRTVASFDELEHKRKNGDVGKWQADYLISTKHGEKIWVSDVSYPWLDEVTGKVKGSVGSLRDITDRVRIENSVFFNFEQAGQLDTLTGLMSKQLFFNEIEKELKRIKRSKAEVALVIIDIDGLERINSEIGTFFGDKAIIRVTDTLQNSLRETDTIARITGGTFAALLPETSVRAAYLVAERIRHGIGEAEIKLSGDKQGLKFTVSCGVASTNFLENISATDLYKLADTRLFLAKSSGRNQLAIEEILSLH